MVKNVVSLSGGKDSTALLLMMLGKNIPVHSAVFFDTGWEFPQMHEHINTIESMVDVPIVRLKPEKSFDDLMLRHQVKRRATGEVHRVGYGWPSAMRRWCTRQKIDNIQKYLKGIPGSVSAIGFAADEKNRASRSNASSEKPKIYPLIEWGITEGKALQYCYDKGFFWGGLYTHFDRVSCFCCPLQKLGALRRLRKHYPELWLRMTYMDSQISQSSGFGSYASVQDMENRFAQEERQLELWAE